MYELASSLTHFLPPSSERKSALCLDSIMAYTTFGLDGATASAILPYGFSGRPSLFAAVSSVQWSPPSVVLNRPLPGPPERKVQPWRRKSHMLAYSVFGSCGFAANMAQPLDPLVPASTFFQLLPPSVVL